MTPDILVKATGCRPDIAATFAPLLERAMLAGDITAPEEQAGFLGQCAYESELFEVLEENLHYTAARLCAVWPARFDFPSVDEVIPPGDGPLVLSNGKHNALLAGDNPEVIANVVYGGRMGNGPVGSGDGWSYRGRGLCQLTGRANYQDMQDGTGLPVVDSPDLLLEPAYAVLAGEWFWTSKNLNPFALRRDWVGLTRAWNGGLEGLPERAGLINRALAALKSGG